MATKILTVHFTNSGVPVTGLTPTIDIYELDQLDPNTNPLIVNNGPVTEIGGGWYRYDFTTYEFEKNYAFTFDGGPSLSAFERYKVGGNESYRKDVSDGVWEEQATDHTDVGTLGLLINQTKADTAALMISDTSLATLLNLILKYHRNRTRIDLNNAQMVIYDDDGTTPLTVFNLLDFNGMPNVQEVCEKIPVT